MPRASALYGWLKRESYLPAFVDLQQEPPRAEYGGGIALDLALPAHESLSAPAESLESSWIEVHEYVNKALTLIDAEAPGWIDSDEVRMIKEELGEPPALCYPLYFVSVGDARQERLVYVGKSSAKGGRFRQGHAALTKLLHPKYDGLAKRVYFGSVVLQSSRGEYLPLEWVMPLDFSKQLLSSIEAQLIYWFKPELNSHHVANDNAKCKCTPLHIQNFSGVSRFLDDEFVYE